MLRPARNFRRVNQEKKEFDEKVIQINRVSKKTKGGNRIGFSALIVVGNNKGRVGVALGKAPDTLSAIKKGTRKAKKNLIEIPMKKTTIPFPIQVKRGAARVMLKPAPEGSGVIAGGAVRAVVEAAGVRDIVGKILGTNNKASNVYATFEALKKIQRITKKNRTKTREAINTSEITKKTSLNKDKTKSSKTAKRKNL